MVVAAFRSRHGASNAVLGLVAQRRLIAVCTVALFLEYEAVLERPEHREAAALTIEMVDRLLAALASAMEPVENHFSWRPLLPDPGDEFVLEAAVNGRADAVVTHNVRDFVPAAGRFGVGVVRPGDFLRSMLG